MQLIPTEITIVEIAVIVVLAALAIVALVIAIQQKGRVVTLEATLNEERRRMAELHTFLERVSRTNTTRPDMDMAMGADPYGANPYAAQAQAQAMGALGQPQPGAMPDYNPYAAPMADPAMMAAPQSAPFPAQSQAAAYSPEALRAQEQQAAKQQALEYAKYQERMQHHAEQMQQQAMMPGQPGGRPQRQTQPVPPR